MLLFACHAFGILLRYNEYNKNCLCVPCFLEIRYSEYTQITAWLCLYGSFVLLIMFMFVLLPCPFITALWSPARDIDCVFVTFPFGVLGQVWYMILSIPDLCLLTFRRPSVVSPPIKIFNHLIKPLGQFDSNFIWRLLRTRELQSVQTVLVT